MKYFDDRLKGTVSNYKFASWMTLLAQLPLLLFTLANSFLYQHIKEKVRIAVSMVSILFLLTAIMVKVPMQPHSFFSITMATIWFINSFGAVLQGSLFGLVGLLPLRYSTLFMSGQGLAGIFAAMASVDESIHETKASAALGYFITPCVATLITLLSYLLLPHLIWVMALCVTCVLAVTLSVFPAVTVKVKSVYGNKEWGEQTVGIIIIAYVTSMVQWPSKRSGLFPVLVVSRLPLIMLCNTDNRQYLPVLFSHDITAGALMTFLALGLSLGAALSFLLRNLL
uniref:Solute carrier family 29 member 2 n=1 Tax=Oncorhynchus kisutch TaxID=8019 RepID=A0A8C7KVG3_ONCKI